MEIERVKIFFCMKTSENSYQLWAIDHAEVFGTYNWLLSDLEKLPVELIKSATHQLMACFIEDEKIFTETIGTYSDNAYFFNRRNCFHYT